MGIFEIIIVILILAWLGGFALNLAGGLIHILLVGAIILFIVRVINRSRPL